MYANVYEGLRWGKFDFIRYFSFYPINHVHLTNW